MSVVQLPSTLPPLFPGLPRRLELDAATVAGLIAELDRRYPGLADRLCERPDTLRPHIHVYVDQERATLTTALTPDARVEVVAAISGG